MCQSLIVKNLKKNKTKCQRIELFIYCFDNLNANACCDSSVDSILSKNEYIFVQKNYEWADNVHYI